MDKHIDLSNISQHNLEHLSHCDFCIEQFADQLEEQGLLTAPANLKESILSRSKKTDVQLIAKTNQTSQKLQLFYYSLKVCFATAFALALLLWSSNASFSIYIPSAVQERQVTLEEQKYQAEKEALKKEAAIEKFPQKPNISEKFHEISNYFSRTEVISYDQ